MELPPPAGVVPPLPAHVGRPGTAPTLALARRAVADGAAAVAAVVPYYYAAGDDAIRAHYGALIEGAGAPVYAYTIPSHTHRELEPALLELEALGGGSAGAVLALANVHPEPCVALARAVRDGDGAEAERAQAEMATHEERLRAAGAIPAFKRAVAERLAERGATYGDAVRGPLAPLAPAVGAR